MATAAASEHGPSIVWSAGWLHGIRHCPSPNVGPRPDDVDAQGGISLIVVHSISLPPGEYGGDAIERLFTNRLDWDAHPYYQTIRGLQVSSHFVVRRDGECVQYASCDDRAWHAGRSSWQGRAECNDYAIGIELEGIEGGPFEAAQYDALLRLMRAVSTRYPIRSVAGHEHIAPGRKQDPGGAFDWPYLRRMWGDDAVHFAAG